MSKYLGVVIVLLLVALAFQACGSTGAQQAETAQLQPALQAIVANQPVPSLGGYSWERAQASKLLLLRNEGYATWTYTVMFGIGIVEICPSFGYPQPYAVQITAPEAPYSRELSLPQPEPNSLHMPDNADASWVLCVNGDGEILPQYYEDHVFAVPYRIESDRQLTPVGGKDGQSSVDLNDIHVPGEKRTGLPKATPTPAPADAGLTPEATPTLMGAQATLQIELQQQATIQAQLTNEPSLDTIGPPTD